MRNGKCRGCGAAIVWIRTAGGKPMPCDPDPVLYLERAGAAGKIVTPNGEVLSCDFDIPVNQATGLGYVSHFATCPQAGKLKREERLGRGT